GGAQTEVEVDRPPGRRHFDRSPHHPPVDLPDRAELLGRKHELAGRDQPLPSHHSQEELMAHRRAREDIDDALAVEDEEIPFQRLLDPARPLERRDGPSSRPGTGCGGHGEGSPHARRRYNVTKYGTDRGELLI